MVVHVVGGVDDHEVLQLRCVAQCMCIWPPPSATRPAGIRSSANTASTAPMAAAPMNPAEDASAAPVAVTSEPALLATADRMATPSAAPISWPVIRNPEATQ